MVSEIECQLKIGVIIWVGSQDKIVITTSDNMSEIYEQLKCEDLYEKE